MPYGNPVSRLVSWLSSNQASHGSVHGFGRGCQYQIRTKPEKERKVERKVRGMNTLRRSPLDSE